MIDYATLFDVVSALPQGLQEGWEFGGWKDKTNIHPVSVALMIVMSLAILIGSRRTVIVSLVIVTCIVTFAQRFVIAGLDFPVLRFLVLVGWMRLVIRGEIQGFRVHVVDKAVLAWGLSICLIYTARVAIELPGLLKDAVVFRGGWFVDTIFLFFLFRCLIRDRSDVVHAIRVFAWISVPISAFFVWEQTTGYNAFSMLGGVPERTMVRLGKLRCQGAFSHPILAGAFWSGAAPMFAAMLFYGERNKRWIHLLATVAALVMVVCVRSSTPLIGVAAAVAATALFFVRSWMNVIRGGIVATLVVVHFARDQPVWHLIQAVDLAGGSTGWHRFNLINMFILNAHEWVAMGVGSVQHWNVYKGDITNFYILQGVEGGMLSFGLFTFLVFVMFRAVGRSTSKADRHSERWLIWMLGACLFAHAVNFIGVSYYSKPLLLFYLQVAMVVAYDNVPRTVQARPMGLQGRMRRRIGVPTGDPQVTDPSLDDSPVGDTPPGDTPVDDVPVETK